MSMRVCSATVLAQNAGLFAAGIPGGLDRGDVEIVVTDAELLDEAHVGHESQRVRIDSRSSTKQHVRVVSAAGELRVGLRLHDGQRDPSRKQRRELLAHDRRRNVKSEFSHRAAPFGASLRERRGFRGRVRDRARRRAPWTKSRSAAHRAFGSGASRCRGEHPRDRGQRTSRNGRTRGRHVRHQPWCQSTELPAVLATRNAARAPRSVAASAAARWVMPPSLARDRAGSDDWLRFESAAQLSVVEEDGVVAADGFHVDTIDRCVGPQNPQCACLAAFFEPGVQAGGSVR